MSRRGRRARTSPWCGRGPRPSRRLPVARGSTPAREGCSCVPSVMLSSCGPGGRQAAPPCGRRWRARASAPPMPSEAGQGACGNRRWAHRVLRGGSASLAPRGARGPPCRSRGASGVRLLRLPRARGWPGGARRAGPHATACAQAVSGATGQRWSADRRARAGRPSRRMAARRPPQEEVERQELAIPCAAEDRTPLAWRFWRDRQYGCGRHRGGSVDVEGHAQPTYPTSTSLCSCRGARFREPGTCLKL